MSDKQKQGPEVPFGIAPPRYENRLAKSSNDCPPRGFVRYLYNTARHLATQRASQAFSIRLWDTATQRIVALFHADHDGETAVSLPNAPFGGLEFAEGVPGECLGQLLAAAGKFCQDSGLVQLIIKLPPGGYDEKKSVFLKEVYENQGFTVVSSFLNYHIPVDGTSFLQKIHPSERKRLRKCQRTGFVAEIWENPDPERVFCFLAESRKRQGYALSLDLAQLQKLLTELPDEVKVFVVKDGPEIASLTVAIRVSRRILYNFCPADNLDYRAFSPTVLLNCALYQYAQSEGVELIDLGVSLDQLGNEKTSLIRFKENLGGKPSVKVTYQKIFV